MYGGAQLVLEGAVQIYDIKEEQRSGVFLRCECEGGSFAAGDGQVYIAARRLRCFWVCIA